MLRARPQSLHVVARVDLFVAYAVPVLQEL